MLFLSGREVGYIRNRVLLAALRVYCDVIVLTGGGHGILARTVAGLARWLAHQPIYDVALAGFYGQLIALALSVFQRKPIILDAYVSTYDTLCEDRARFRPRSIPGRLAYWLDQRSCQVASRVMTDTRTHAHYFAHQFGIPKTKLRPIYVGCDEALFYPRVNVSSSSRRCEVFSYSSFLPLHGTEVIVQAAALLKSRPDIHFTLGGDGAGLQAVRQMVEELGLGNIDLVGWIPMERLPAYIAEASICLGGHFSTIPKAARVISTKTFQFIAMRKPTIVGDNAATRELFVPGEHVYAVPMGDPAALAKAISELADDAVLRDRIAAGGYALFQERLTTHVIAGQLASLIEEVQCASA
ncbi:MAG: glycosyltransferase [Anaerolineae bacterium]|nr:glycosyltransferase [Anaerolineae bacterium]